MDQIAMTAGVARRTFFRYFPTKEDAVFPDHDATLSRVQSVLDAAESGTEPLTVVCRGIAEVLRMYAADPAVSLARYRLLREVPALREREIAVVSRYERLFTKYLLGQPSASASPASPDAPLLAEVSAAAVVAAHNHVLRRWLRAGGQDNPMEHLDHALRAVRDRFADPLAAGGSRKVVVAVATADTGTEDVIAAVRRALD